MCPNWVTNNVRFTDNKWKELVIGKDEKGFEKVDFNILKPMPKDLDIVSGSGSWNINKYGFMRDDEKEYQETLKPLLDKCYDDCITQNEYFNKVKANFTDKELNALNKYYAETSEERKQEYLERRIKCYFNLQRYGTVDWYDWHTENWGTKWNACDCCIDDTAISFNTAWANPYNWYEELAQYCDFNFSFADEDTGSNCGYGYAQNGIITIHYISENPYYSFLEKQFLAIIIQGYEYEEQMEMYDEWNEEPQERLSQEKQEELYNIIKDFI